MKLKLLFVVLCCVCAALPIAAQTAAPENMVLVPAGNFWIGRTQTFFLESVDIVARDRMDETPASNIHLDAFYIDKYEVANADYARFVAAKGIRPPWHWPQGRIPTGEEKFPASNVNWFEATDYCQSAGKRLPTEAEWEKAARGGLDRNRYAWGDQNVDTMSEEGRLQEASVRNTNAPVPAALGRNRAVAIGSFRPNGYGLFDMIGNVMEWTNDWYDNNYYPFMPKENPRGPESGRYRSVRGSSWGDTNGHGQTKMVHYRNFSDPELRSPTIGFRCAKDAEK
jgi:formylglycine-generating enzyme